MLQKDKPPQNCSTWKFSSVFVMQFVARDWICGNRKVLNCIMSTHRRICHNWLWTSWQRKEFQLFGKHPIRQTWPHLTFGYFPKSSSNWKAYDFKAKMTSCRMRQISWRSFHQTSLRPASNSGSIAGWSVWMLKEPILKEIRTVCNLCGCLQYVSIALYIETMVFGRILFRQTSYIYRVNQHAPVTRFFGTHRFSEGENCWSGRGWCKSATNIQESVHSTVHCKPCHHPVQEQSQGDCRSLF